MKVHQAKSYEDIKACFSVMAILRPHLVDTEFIEKVRRQELQGYRLIYTLHADKAVAAVAGFRIADFLAWGHVLYIDDLITSPERRGNGHARALLDWLMDHAREQHCDALHLDSGHQRHDAHRLYLNKGMTINSHHFSINLQSQRKT